MTIRRHKIIVERDEQFDGHDHCLAMWSDGSIRVFASPGELLRAVKRSDMRAARAGAGCITTIEWRDGLKPPEGA